VAAVDIAGNFSASSQLTATCTPDTHTPLDAGASTMDTGAPLASGGGGCSASANNSGLLSALAALLHRKRTR